MIPTTPDQLQQLLAAPEGRRLEFKEAESSYDFDKLVEYCVALANEGGGQIILGATDKRPRQVVGTAAFREPGETESQVFARLAHRVRVEEVDHEGKRVLIVHVPSRLPGTAWEDRGRYLRRAGDSLVAIPADDLREIFAEGGPDFSAGLSPAPLTALSPEAIALFRSRWAKKVQNERILGWTDIQTLTDAELLVDGQVTYAALILLGTHAAMGRWLGQAELVFEYRSNENAGPAQDRVEHREGFLLWVDALWERINLRNDRQTYQEGFFRWDIPTFDEKSVREAVLNAVAHREYRSSASVFVRQYARRLEIVSPGGFPPGITSENMLDQQNPRNRRLADALLRCGLVERSGQGANLMFERAIRQGKTLPDYSGTAAHEVRLTLHGVLEHPGLVRFLERLGEEKLRAFSTQDFLALSMLHADRRLPEALRARMPGLVEVGAVEVVGRGKSARYLLSRSLSKAIGELGTHTRRVGLDHETNKALLLKHLDLQGEEGAPMSELRQVLPAQSSRTLLRLLHELQADGKVVLRGVRRHARWHVVSASDASARRMP